jgi:acyl-CoA synthetase (AMP-forming)/AMP-acid ligase II
VRLPGRGLGLMAAMDPDHAPARGSIDGVPQSPRGQLSLEPLQWIHTLNVSCSRRPQEAMQPTERMEGWARWQLPDRVEVIDRIPTTSVGKFDKKALRALLQAG